MRATHGLTALAPILALLMSGQAMAADDALTVPADQRTALALTVYEQDLALVQDRRMVKLTEGLNRVAFADVSAKLRPETVLVETAGGEPLRLVEQRFEGNLLTPRALLEASVGKPVRVAIRNPQTGIDSVEPATVLSAAQGLVLQIGDRIEAGAPGRLVYNEVPPGLRDKPTLELALTSLKGGSMPVELGYLTGGLGWSANYVAELDPSERKLSLSGRASITNHSGTSYGRARLTLVSGAPNRVPEEQPPSPLPRFKTMAMAAAPASAPPASEPLGDYYRFPLDREITLGNQESVQIALLQSADVPVKKEYWLADAAPVTAASDEAPTPLPITVRLHFRNDKAAGLGGPLPRGIVRVYQRGKDGALAFLGEDRMGATPEGKPVKLTLGQAFEVTAERRQTSTAHPAEKSFEAKEEIALHNAKDQPVTVTVVESIPGDWRILEESAPHEKPTAAAAQWQVEVPAKGETKLTYRVLTHF
jgi:hypothetical protein